MIKRLAVIVVAVVMFMASAPSPVIAPQSVTFTSFKSFKISTWNPPKPLVTPTPTPPVIYEITAYTSGPESTGKRRGQRDYGVTAAGTTVLEGYTIACPASIPFGTVISIDTVGERTCADRGSRITAGHIDVYVNDLSTARKFGRRHLPIQILPMGSGYVE